MSQPSFFNIDLWLFELAEGNLNEYQVEELKLFLLNHPELDVDKDVWNLVRVKTDNVLYPNQSGLIRKRSKRVIVGASTAAVMLLTFVGCYSYMNYSNNNTVRLALNSDHNQAGAYTGIGTSNPLLAVKKIQKEADDRNINAGGISSSDDLSASTYLAGKLNYHPLSTLNTFDLFEEIRSGSWMYASNNSNSVTQGSSESREGASSVTEGVAEIQSVLENSSLGLVESNVLEPARVKTLTNTSKRKSKTTINRSKRSLMKSSGHKESFRSKFRKFRLKLNRMFDNPIALKNFRDPHYHVPGKLANDINFSSTGTLLRTRVQAMSRMQWLGQENQQLMNQLSIDGYAYRVRGGFGVQLNHSIYNYGGINVSDAAFTYSPKFSITNFISVEPSVRFKMGNKLLNSSRMSGVEQVEMSRGNVIDYYKNGATPKGNNLWYKDVGLGLMVNTKWFFVGMQVDNLFHHRDNIYSDDIANPRTAGTEFFATGGVDWESKKEDMKLSPYIVYHKLENLSEAWLGLNYQYNWFTVGASVSSNMEPAASIGMKFDQFALLYNADYTISEMTGVQSLSHQLTIRFTGKPSGYGRKLLNLR